MMDRRKTLVVLAASGIFAPLATRAQAPAGRTYRVGILGLTSAAGSGGVFDAMRVGLREFGYVEGRNLIIESRWADDRYASLPALAAELVRLKVDVLVTQGTPGVRAARHATSTIPIVMANVGGDPVANGLVASLARPGGNVTGTTTQGTDLSAKRMELVKETLPHAQRVGVLFNPDNGGLAMKTIESAAAKLKLDLAVFEVREAEGIEGAFAAMPKRRVDALIVFNDSMLNAHVAQVVAAAARQKLPLFGIREVAEAGGLMAYGVNRQAVYRRSAYFVDKILRGAKPAEIPVEQVARIELIVNLKTAKALGIRIPPALMARADEVIE